MIKIKQFFKEATIKFHITFMCFLIAWIIGAAWIYANLSKTLFYLMFIVFVCLYIFDVYYAIHKTADNYIYKYKQKCFDEVKKFVSSKYVRIYVFSSSRLDKSLEYYGKIDSDGTILVYGKNKLGKEVFKHWTLDPNWFMNNFFTM